MYTLKVNSNFLSGDNKNMKIGAHHTDDPKQYPSVKFTSKMDSREE